MEQRRAEMERGIKKRELALASAKAEAGDSEPCFSNQMRTCSAVGLLMLPLTVLAVLISHSFCSEVEGWTAKIATLEGDEVVLSKKLQALQEDQRQKRAAVVKEATVCTTCEKQNYWTHRPGPSKNRKANRT